MFGQTSHNTNPNRSNNRNNSNVNGQLQNNVRPHTTTNPYTRRTNSNNSSNRTSNIQQLPRNVPRINNYRDNNTIRELPNAGNSINDNLNNPNLELSSEELSLPHLSGDNSPINREENNRNNGNNTPSEHRNPTTRELLTILHNLPDTPENNNARNRLFHLANNNQLAHNRAPNNNLPTTNGRHDFVRASNLVTNNSIQRGTIRTNCTLVTPQNHHFAPPITAHEGTDFKTYFPNDKRLIPVGEALASQPKAVRPILEKISSTIISLSNLIFEKNKTLEVWNNPTNNRIFENNELDLDTLDEEFYVPNSLKLNNVKLKVQHGISSNENYKEKFEQITKNFEKAKIRFKICSSKCAKEIAKLKYQSTIEKRGQVIIKQFLLTLTYYIRYYKNKSPDLLTTTKHDPLLAACILINFLSKTEQNFFIWAKIDKNKFLNMIVNELGERDDDLNNITTHPLQENEKNFAKKLENEFLKKTFIQLTMNISTIQYNSKQFIEDNKNLSNIIRNNDLEKITAATREGLNNINILESSTTLESFLQERDKNLEKKIWSKIKANQLQQQKNSIGSHKFQKYKKQKPVDPAKRKGSSIKYIKKPKTILNIKKKGNKHSMTPRQNTFPQRNLKQIEKKKTHKKHTLQNQTPNKRRREFQDDMRKGKRREQQKRRRK